MAEMSQKQFNQDDTKNRNKKKKDWIQSLIVVGLAASGAVLTGFCAAAGGSMFGALACLAGRKRAEVIQLREVV